MWIHFYFWDSQTDIDPGVMADSRVTQYWDPGQVTGRWFGDHVHGGGLAWDVYFLYGPSARWDAGPPDATGSPVIGDTDRLTMTLQHATAAASMVRTHAA